MRTHSVRTNNYRRVINSDVEYYDSQGDYAHKKWDYPVLRVDSLVEMETVPDTDMVIPDEDISMVADGNTAESGAIEGAGEMTLM